MVLFFVVCGWREETVAGVCQRTYLVHSTYVFFCTRGYERRKNRKSSCSTHVWIRILLVGCRYVFMSTHLKWYFSYLSHFGKMYCYIFSLVRTYEYTSCLYIVDTYEYASRVVLLLFITFWKNVLLHFFLSTHEWVRISLVYCRYVWVRISSGTPPIYHILEKCTATFFP